MASKSPIESHLKNNKLREDYKLSDWVLCRSMKFVVQVKLFKDNFSVWILQREYFFLNSLLKWCSQRFLKTNAQTYMDSTLYCKPH